jgi:hypothetical protein
MKLIEGEEELKTIILSLVSKMSEMYVNDNTYSDIFNNSHNIRLMVDRMYPNKCAPYQKHISESLGDLTKFILTN